MKLLIGFLFHLVLPYSECFENEQTVSKEWTAKWMGAPKNLIPESLKKLPKSDTEVFKLYPGLKPALYFRKEVELINITEATAYCAARGAFRLYINRDFPLLYNHLPTLAPGWTDYNKTIQYYKYDVTNDLQIWEVDAIGVELSPGWYSGYIGDNYNLYGDEVSALLEIHVRFQNGSTTVIKSDDSWKVNTGHVLYSDKVYGEFAYENDSIGYWSYPGYDETDWLPVVTQIVNKNLEFVEDTSPTLQPRGHHATTHWQVGNDTSIFAFDELIYGGVGLQINEFPYATKLTVRVGESLYPNGSLYTGRNGLASVAYTYAINDIQGRQPYFSMIPRFQSHSFRYVEVTGLPGGFYDNELSTFLCTQNTIDATLSTDNEIVKKLFHYLTSSVLANMNSVPTVAPFGVNSLGWLEPAGLFSSTAFNLFDARYFYRKWLRDIRNSQGASGAYSNVAPNVHELGDASPGSGFAPILIAYNLYKYHEDIDEVERNYAPNENWLKYVISNNPNFLYTNNINENYGDYANVNSETPKEVLSSAYFAFSSLLMSRMAKILQKSADEEYYEALHKNISSAFVKAYVNAVNGEINGDTQTGYVLALASKVLPEDLIPKAVQMLVDNIKAHNFHLTTGYIGTAFILPVLADYGHIDVAYKLLLQESYPSWGYMFHNANRSGLWEHWNFWTEKDGFQGSSLNSVGLGSVGNFLFQYIAGINSDEEQISFKKVLIKPYIGKGINSLSTRIITNYGFITSSWNVQGNVFSIEVTLPQNTTGKLTLPFASRTWIRELSPGKQKFQFSLHTNEI